MKHTFKASQGASIAQYAIVIALISIAVIPVLVVLGNQIVSGLTGYNSQMAENNRTIENSKRYDELFEDGKITPGELNGTSTEPNIFCADKSCSLDFGNYVLDGIPENFSEYIESTSTSGGTEKLSSLLDQLAEKAPVDEDTKNLIQQLADNGHWIARIEESLYEDDVKPLFGQEDLDLFSSESTAVVSDDFYESCHYQDFQTILQQLNDNIGSSTDPDYQNTLALVNALSDDINNIAKAVGDQTQEILTSAYDNHIITEEEAQAYEAFLTDGSIATDIDSKLICETGNGEDNGYTCN